jgi:predicted lipase
MVRFRNAAYDDSNIPTHSNGFTAILKFNTSLSQPRYMAVVAFTGTLNSQDWEDSLLKSDLNELDMHAGYFNRVYNVKDYLEKKLNDLRKKYDFQDVLFTGHSMGGTEATIATVLLKHAFPETFFHVITFGQSKPGGYQFRKYAEQSIAFHRRIVNCGDPASGMPRSDEYTHVDDGVTLYTAFKTLKLTQKNIENESALF